MDTVWQVAAASAGALLAVFAWYLIGLAILAVFIRFTGEFDKEDGYRALVIIVGPLALVLAIPLSPLILVGLGLFFAGRWLYENLTVKAYASRTGNG